LTSLNHRTMTTRIKTALLAGLLFSLLLATGCKKNESANNFNVSIGQSYQGGILAYVLQPGDVGYNANTVKGLIAAPTDQSAAITWNNGSAVLITGTTGGFGTGKANTDLIISKQGSGNYAASICASLSSGGYTDWYLPNTDELYKLYENQTAIGGFNNGPYENYWSSNGGSGGIARVINFSYGLNSSSDNTGNTHHVRAVRFFAN
jgi:hypothetical protein